MNNKQKYSSLLAICFIVAITFILIPDKTLANGAVQRVIIDGADSVFATLLGVVRNLLAFILDLISGVLTWAIGYSDFFNEGVRAGWTTTRDFANLFFALALLFIAIATVVGGPIDNYSAKRMLPTFIFIALLINFSLPIVGIFVDISQIIMIEFYNAIIADGSGIGDITLNVVNLGQLSAGNANVSVSSLETQSFVSENGGLDDTIQTLFTIIVLAILIFTILWTALALVVRIVTIWIVIMTAPLAFVSDLFPPLKGLQRDWMKKFQGALVEGPVIIFILYLGFTVLGAISDTGSFTIANLSLVTILFFLANIQAKQAASAAPGAVKNFTEKSAGFLIGAATFGAAGYLGVKGAMNTGDGFKRGGKLVNSGINRTADLTGNRARLEVAREDAKDQITKGKFLGGGLAGAATQLTTKEGREYRLNQDKTAVLERKRDRGETLSPANLKALRKAESEYYDKFKDEESPSNLIEQYKNTDDSVKKRAIFRQLTSLEGGIDEFLTLPQYEDLRKEFATDEQAIVTALQREGVIGKDDVISKGLLAVGDKNLKKDKDPRAGGLNKAFSDLKANNGKSSEQKEQISGYISKVSKDKDEEEILKGIKASMLQQRKSSFVTKDNGQVEQQFALDGENKPVMETNSEAVKELKKQLIKPIVESGRSDKEINKALNMLPKGTKKLLLEDLTTKSTTTTLSPTEQTLFDALKK